MKKKLFLILIMPALALVVGYLIREAFATSNPHAWNNGLVGYWSFDGQYTTTTSGTGAGTRDVSNNGNWGTFNGGVKPATGVVGQALSFDGVDDYVNVSDADSLDIAGNLTIEAWVKFNSITQTNQSIVAKNTSSNTGYWFWYNWTGAPSRFGFWGVNGMTASSTTFLALNEWTQVVVIREGTNVSFYINGVLDVTRDMGGTVNPVSYNPFKISTRSENTTYPFNGSIDEVRIYNRALSADEVKQHYDQTRRNIAINNPSGTPPVGWWKMDEATGATVRDYSVNANTGTKYWMSTSTDYGLVDGKIGKALSFDGTDDYVVASSMTGPLKAEGTVSFWYKPTNVSGTKVIISQGHGTGGLGNYTIISQSGANITVGIWTTTYFYTTATNVLSAGQWIHVVFVNSVSSSQNKLYINGVLAANGSVYQDSSSNHSRLEIGRNSSNVSYVNGLIDDVRIYNYARTADQIAADYRAGAYRTIVASSVPSNWWTGGLVGYWSFDGQYTTTTSGTGAGTRDVSNNGNWGAFNGGVKPATGVVGQAMSFDGVDDYVLTTDGNTNISAANTFEVWVKVLSSPGTSPFFRTIVGKSTAYLRGLYWVTTGYTVGFYFMADSEASTKWAKIAYTPSPDWHHIVGTWDGSRTRIYMDGVLKATATADDTWTNDTVAYRFGGTPTDRWANIVLDEVRIYNRALSADEVMQHYQQTRRNLKL